MNHYENISRYLQQILKAEVMSNVMFTSTFSYYKLTRLPQIVLRGFDKIPNEAYGIEEKTEVNGIDITGDTTNGSAIIMNIESTARLSANDEIAGNGIPDGSIILSVGETMITLDENATITNTEVDLTITFEKVEVYKNCKKNDMEYELILATNRKLGILDYQNKLDQFFMKYGTITVDSQEYDIDIIAPFTNNTIPNYSDLKSISGRFQVKEVKILGDIYTKVIRVKTVDIGMESK